VVEIIWLVESGLGESWVSELAADLVNILDLSLVRDAAEFLSLENLVLRDCLSFTFWRRSINDYSGDF
jgi:hypothetical protein